jgi:prepilin-type N-terminal cleavage/methylation domain-containing protein
MKSMHLTLIPKTNRGFTFVELMVCVAIIGILAGIAIPSYIKYRERGFIAQATGDLKKLQRAVQDLGHDTGRWPSKGANKLMAGVAAGFGFNNELWDLSIDEAGLAATDDNYPQWQGPYYTEPFQDPWGKNYFMDHDYDMNGRTVAAIGSFGPNKCCENAYDDDDIILIIPAN